MNIERVEWTNEQQRIVGTMYQPAGDGPFGAVVLCHGFAGVKELLLPAYAERFAAAGLCALSFDYRGFGESEGEPGRLVPALQVSDIRSAVDFLAEQPKVDASRLAMWGTSLGGANAVVAASGDPRIKALAVQLTFASGRRVVTGSMDPVEAEKFLATLTRMKEKRDKTGKEMMVPLKKVLTDPQSSAFYERFVDQFDALKIKVPFLTVLETLGHNPERFLPELTAPIHVVGALRDAVNPPEESRRLFEQANDPKQLLMVDATHYQLYEGEQLEQVSRAQIEWFRRYLDL